MGQKKMKKVGEKPGKRNDDKNMRTIGCNNVVLSTKKSAKQKCFFPIL